MRIHLVFPALADTGGQLYTQSLFAKLLRPLFGVGDSGFSPPLSLLMLAAVTPPGIDVRLVDERLEEIGFDDPVDLVGITVATRAAFNAYRIADEYRRRGVKVVLGGVHPSALPAEATEHADAVVVGEGEAVWPQIVEDCRAGRLQPRYDGGHDIDQARLPRPRRDIIPDPWKYGVAKVVFASRGCPNGCSFCACGVAVGRRYRTRPVEHVIAEMRSIPGRVMVFADDSLGWDVDYTKALPRAMVPLGLRWFGELSLNAVEDEELLDLAAASGCAVLGLGFESLSPQALASVPKGGTNDPGRYPELIRRVHKRGIAVLGFLMLGFDEDDPGVFERQAAFIEATNLEMPSFNTLSPYPATPLLRKLAAEGRLLHRNWDNYDTIAGEMPIRLKNLAPQQMRGGYVALTARVHTLGGALRRLAGAGTVYRSQAGLIPVSARASSRISGRAPPGRETGREPVPARGAAHESGLRAGPTSIRTLRPDLAVPRPCPHVI